MTSVLALNLSDAELPSGIQDLPTEDKLATVDFKTKLPDSGIQSKYDVIVEYVPHSVDRSDIYIDADIPILGITHSEETAEVMSQSQISNEYLTKNEDSLHNTVIADQIENTLLAERDKHRKLLDRLTHDIRNLINVAIGYAELSDENPNADKIISSLNRSDQLIQRYRSISRYGEEEKNIERLNLCNVAQTCAQTSLPENVSFICNPEDDIFVYADKNQISTLIENIFRNATEHNNTSELTVQIGCLDDNQGIYIEDNGRGIPEGEKRKIFSTGFTTDDDSGSGLGLTIVEEICRVNDWVISVTDEESGGARFEFANMEIK